MVENFYGGVICFTISINMGFTETMAKVYRALIDRFFSLIYTETRPSEIDLITRSKELVIRNKALPKSSL